MRAHLFPCLLAYYVESHMRETWRPLLEDLESVTRNVCRAKGQTGARPTEFELDTQLSAEHARVLELLRGIRV